MGNTTAARIDPTPVALPNNHRGARPATSWVSLCRTITNISRLLMPSTIRCAASPASVAATVGTAVTVRKTVRPPGGHRVDHRPVDRASAVVRAEHVRRKAP